MIRSMFLALSALSYVTAPAPAQKDDGKKDEKVEKFSIPPKGFDARRDGIDRGERTSRRAAARLTWSSTTCKPTKSSCR